jgi:hypothetical protein
MQVVSEPPSATPAAELPSSPQAQAEPNPLATSAPGALQASMGFTAERPASLSQAVSEVKPAAQDAASRDGHKDEEEVTVVEETLPLIPAACCVAAPDTRTEASELGMTLEQERAAGMEFLQENVLGADLFAWITRRFCPDGLNKKETAKGRAKGLELDLNEPFRAVPVVNVCVFLLLFMLYMIIAACYVVDPSNGHHAKLQSPSADETNPVTIMSLQPGLLSADLFSYAYRLGFWKWIGILLGLQFLLRSTTDYGSGATLLEEQTSTEGFRDVFKQFSRHIYLREIIFCGLTILIIGVFYFVVRDQDEMADIQPAPYLSFARPESGRKTTLSFHEIIAMASHAVAILLGCILLHTAEYPAESFLSFGYALRMRELDESAKPVPNGSEITIEALLEYAVQLRDMWYASITIIDLVDITDFYLLLFEEDLYQASDTSNQFGKSDWELIRRVWLLAFVFSLCGGLLDRFFIGLFGAMQKKHLARCSWLPDGMTFWQTYVMKREAEKKERSGLDKSGPYPGAWKTATDYYAFNLPRKKNQRAFSSAFRSLVFVEVPFLYWRVLCSEKYGIVASSLIIKNLMSFVYDLYITLWGFSKLYVTPFLQAFSDPSRSTATDGEFSENDPHRSRLLQRRATRTLGAVSWLTTAQLACQPECREAHEEFERTGVYPEFLYHESMSGRRLQQVDKDVVLQFLEQSGMVT